jgi:hypothetical protein
MKKILGYAVAAAVLVLPAVAFAAEFRMGDQASVRADERVSNDVYLAGSTVTSAGSVAGDVVAGGGTVVISGAVGADVLAAGGNLTILSSVGDDVRVAGGNVVIEGGVGGDIIAGGGQITIGGPGARGDIVIGGGNVRIDAPVGGNVKIAGGMVYLNAPVAGSVTIEAGTVTLGSNAVIAGDLAYKADKELVKEEGAVVKGKIQFTQRNRSQIPAAALAALFSIWVLGKFVVLLVCALFVGLVFKRYSKELVAKVTKRPWLELGRGFLVLVALPAASVLLMASIIGLPFGLLGVLSFIAALLFAWIVAPIIVGSVLYRYFSKREWEVSWKTIVLGVLVYSVVGLVPILGGLLQLAAILLALGAIAAVKWEIVRQWR